MKDKKTTYKKDEKSKMPFDEVMERIVRVKKKIRSRTTDKRGQGKRLTIFA